MAVFIDCVTCSDTGPVNQSPLLLSAGLPCLNTNLAAHKTIASEHWSPLVMILLCIAGLPHNFRTFAAFAVSSLTAESSCQLLQLADFKAVLQVLPMQSHRLSPRHLQHLDPTAAAPAPQPTLWPRQSAKPMYLFLFSPQPLLKPLLRPSAQAMRRPQPLPLLLLWLPTKAALCLRHLLRYGSVPCVDKSASFHWYYVVASIHENCTTSPSVSPNCRRTRRPSLAPRLLSQQHIDIVPCVQLASPPCFVAQAHARAA